MLAATLVVACGPAVPPTDSFGLDEAARARQALARLPQVVEHFRAGRYGLAAEGFDNILATLPPSDHAATAAALFGLEGPGHSRRLRASLETNLGLCHLRSRRYQSAIAILERAARTDPGSPVVHSNLGIALLRAKRYPEAQRAFDEAIRRGGGDVRLHRNLGEAALRNGDRRRASQALRAAVRLAETAPSVDARGAQLEAERLLAELAADDGRLDEARWRLEAVLAESPGDPLPRYLLLRVLVRLDDHAAATHHRELLVRHAATMGSMQSVLADGSDGAAGLHWLADTYLSLGLDHLAEVHYRQLRVRNPADADARRGLAAAQARWRRAEESRDERTDE